MSGPVKREAPAFRHGEEVTAARCFVCGDVFNATKDAADVVAMQAVLRCSEPIPPRTTTPTGDAHGVCELLESAVANGIMSRVGEVGKQPRYALAAAGERMVERFLNQDQEYAQWYRHLQLRGSRQ